MDFNVWNIKEMLSIPSGSGTIKSSNWNINQTDYSSLSDSQFLFGSQFCPENSETLSTPLDVGTHLRYPKQSQQSSLDNEPSIFTKYQAKPQLFGGDTKDGGLFPLPLSVGKSKGLLEQFEEKKKRAKDKCDSETLWSFISHVKENIHRLQTSVEKSEEYLSYRSQSILDSLETVAKTLQDTMQAQSELVLEALKDKGRLEQIILEMQNKFEARQAEFVEMKSNLKHLEVLVAQQNKDFQQLCEQLGQLNIPSVLADLRKFIAAPPVRVHAKDSTAQTSPLLAQTLISQGKLASEEAVMWQSQPFPGTWNTSVGSLQPRKFGVWDEDTKSDAQPSKRNKAVQDKEVQTNCEHCAFTKVGPRSYDTSILGQEVPVDRDLVTQGTSQVILSDLSNFATNTKVCCREYQLKDVFSCDPCGQSLVTEPKGGIIDRGKKGKKKQPKKTRRSRLLARKQDQAPSKTSALSSRIQGTQPSVSGLQGPHLGQREPLQPSLCQRGSRSPAKPVCPTLRGAVMLPKTTGEMQGRLLRLDRCSSQDSSPLPGTSQGDQEISWFSNLNIENSQSPSCKKPGRNLLYDLAFDSSDEGF
ncbi:PREDICTED: coiled-coil domain-containing protein 36 [Elephantulus edwardii]|uniref:coiled-coil domain-containing protein 36 n=1 Tax=Elephantulus edwardii TaxID=28737 RepID=UPI0003F06876|nr:PREDICTED: coiled-coil domain-containing protein 36 [Elephantulus edwardii]